MRLLTGIAATLAALLDAIFGVFRALFTRDDPAARLDDLEAQVRDEIDALEDRPMFEHDDEPNLGRGPKVGDGRDVRPVDVARRFLAGHNDGYSLLPRRMQAWLILAADRGVVVEDATDSAIGAWLAGTEEHPRVPRTAVAAVTRGEHPPAEVVAGRGGDAWSPTPAPAF